MIFNRSLRYFLTLVVIPLAIAGGGTVWLTADLVTRLSTDANGEDHKRTAEIVESALNAARQQLANTVADNANWDDAAIEMFAPVIDKDFVASAWGAPSAAGVNYDGVLVTDGAGRRIAASVKGKPEAVDPAAYFAGRLLPMQARLPQNHTTFGSVSGFVETAGGTAVVAVGNIVPTTANLELGTGEPRFLVFWKFMSPEFIKAIGDKFVVKDLRIVPITGSRQGDVMLTNEQGDRLGAMQWQDRRPGDVAMTTVLPKAYAMLLLLITVMTTIALVCWRQFRLIAARERQAQCDAKQDALTGLPNRNALMETLSGLLRDATGTVCVTFVDLDGFKEVNDTYDHETGDRLIKAVAAGLAVLAGSSSLISRIGGDEFVIVHGGSDAAAEARATASRIIAFLDLPIDIDGRMARVGASVGIAMSDTSRMMAGELMRQADIAMYAAKAAGKNRYCVFNAAMDLERDETAAIVAELRLILAQGRLEAAYQPIIDAQTLRVTGVEALARWPASSAFNFTPDRFIHVAETSGLIDRLGNAILEKACTDALAWPGLRISVNVSPVQLRNPNFAADTLAIIRGCGFDPARVELEVTEGTMIDDIVRLRPMFRTLHEAGVSIALDDFGSGYSSIAYLRELSFNRIKIDRSLTKSMLTSEMARNMIQATGLIASGVSAAVTAEGVEAEEEIQFLRLAGCTELQGFYFGRPQSAAAITAVIETAQLNQAA